MGLVRQEGFNSTLPRLTKLLEGTTTCHDIAAPVSKSGVVMGVFRQEGFNSTLHLILPSTPTLECTALNAQMFVTVTEPSVVMFRVTSVKIGLVSDFRLPPRWK
jgi:hypothetical protein